MAPIEFRLFGPFEVRRQGRLVADGGGKRQSLLALLLLSANRVVTVDLLTTAMWGEHAPRSATNLVQGYVSYWRNALDPQREHRVSGDRLTSTTGGYCLRVSVEECDLLRFRAHAVEGRRAVALDEPYDARRILRTAISERRGPALAAFDGPRPSVRRAGRPWPAAHRSWLLEGLDDLFTPEINSVADKAGDDWTQVNSLTQRYDHFKVRAVLNEIHGFDHSGRRRVGVPGVFGMNFQSVSTAQKLPTSNGLRGGYTADGRDPGPLLRGALSYVDHEVASMVRALWRTHQLRDTAIILSSKHGQSPVHGSRLKRTDDGVLIDALNSAWQRQHPGRPQPLVAASLNDDGMLLWFTPGDQTRLADHFATAFLHRYDGDGTGTDGHAKATNLQGDAIPYTSAGIRSFHAGPHAATFLGARRSDPRVPDVIGTTQYGVVYTSKTAKIAEHGGDHAEDRHVPLVVAGPGVRHAVRTARVLTTQVAPTMLALLGLRPRALEAVRAEHTRTLPLK